MTNTHCPAVVHGYAPYGRCTCWREKNMPGPFSCVYCGQDTTECRRAAKLGAPCGA